MAKPGDNIVIITGPESTGKSVLTAELAEKFNVEYTPEYARSYISGLDKEYSYNDIEQIARWQIDDFVNRIKKQKLHFIDTYLILTKVWFLWRYTKYPEYLDDAIKATHNCLYLLCYPDIKWEPDPLRENGGENRTKLFNLYKGELDNHGMNYKVINGIDDKRSKLAYEYVKEFLYYGR